MIAPPAPSSGLTEPLRPAHVGLIAMLLFTSICEGFDVSLTSVVVPYAAREFHADTVAIGHALSFVGLGSIASWLVIRLADRYGRRPILILAATGFGLGALATMLATTMQSYAMIQSAARLLMVSQVTLGYLIVSETLPARLRGRANGLLGAGGSVGAALPFLLLGPAMASPLQWRAMFLIGAAPLLVVPLLLLWLRETPAFVPHDGGNRARSDPLAQLRALTAPPRRLRFAGMSALWFIINFSSGVSGLFFTLYVLQERHWTVAQLAWLAPGIAAGALGGNLLSGLVMDMVGRRAALSMFLIAAGALTQTVYLATSWWVIALAWVGVQATFGIWVIGFTINAELFPASMRAAAAGWCNSLIGRWGMVAAPAALGTLAHSLHTTSHAAGLLACVAYLGVPLVWLTLPETRNLSLIDPDDALAPEIV